MKKLSNLESVIKKLNSPSVYEDEVLESQFNFKYQIEDNHIRLFDSNEVYNYDYLDEINSLLYGCAMEFGVEYSPMTEDDIFNELETAIRKDLGADKYIEWEDNVVMSIYY